MFSEAFAFGKAGNADKKLKIHLYQVDMFYKWLKETMKNKTISMELINSLINFPGDNWISRIAPSYPSIYGPEKWNSSITDYWFHYVIYCVSIVDEFRWNSRKSSSPLFQWIDRTSLQQLKISSKLVYRNYINSSLQYPINLYHP